MKCVESKLINLILIFVVIILLVLLLPEWVWYLAVLGGLGFCLYQLVLHSFFDDFFK